MLNDKENKKYETIDKVINGEMTRKEASIKLDLSLRQIDKLKRKYITNGKDGFIHGNRGRANPNKKDDSLINELEELYLSEFYDFTFEQFYEKIFGKYNISYDSMLKRFTSDGILSPLAHKKTLREYKETIKEAIANKNECIQQEKIELYKSRIIAFEKAHTRRSSNLFVFGQEVQMDACEKLWFGGIVSYLHL
ncbi:MAG: hypothetical protein K2J20_03695 [Bacilli bacterium]|nr:hypothetical protein [Bacilli bacterium]